MMERLTTNDGSTTLYSDKYQEYFHTKSGAMEEAFEKFVKPCNIKPGSKILDIGFGLGYNLLAALYSAKNLRIVSLEKDESVLKEIQDIKLPKHLKEKYKIVQKAAKNFYYKDDDFEIVIILGDAVNTIKGLEEKFDTVFLDPFSPSRNPELWTTNFFKDVKRVMKKNAILATYSYARAIRDNLREAGFIIKDGPVIGRRSPSTLAVSL